MMKLIPLFVGLMFPLSGAFADNFVDEAVKFCKNKGGQYVMGAMTENGDKYCKQVTCKKTTVDGKYVINEGDKGPEANIEATTTVCVAKAVIDGNFNPDGSGGQGVDVNGDGVIDSKDDINGDGIIDGRDLDEWRRRQGNNNNNNNNNNGKPDNTGTVIVDNVGGVQCEYVLSGTLSGSHPCIKHCKKHWLTGKEGAERKKCRECIEKYSVENGGDLVVDWDIIVAQGGKKPNKKTINIGGVQVKTGEIICYDLKTGAIVSRTGTGQLCPHGSSTTPGGVVVSTTGGAVGGVTSGSGNGTVIIQGGVNGGVQLPEFCKSNKKKDKTACENWMRANSRFACSSSANPAGCMGQDYYDIQNRYNYDGCVNCGGGKRRDNSWLGDALGGLFIGGGQALSAYFGGQAYVKGQEAWAGAATAGFEQCQIHNNNYLAYLQANELPAMSPDQQAAMGCNGFGLNQYGGMGWGGMGGWNGAGYSNGFLGGMMGPYGGYNPYGMGGMGGGIGIGIGGGYPGGYAGGMAGGYPGGYAGGMAGGYPGGYAGGMAGGYPGGYAGGMAGGIGIGIGGGYPGGYAGGMAGGYPGGYAGGIAGGYPGGYAGGMAGGYPGGYAGGMAGGYPGGYAGGIGGGIGIGGGMGGYNPYGTGGWGSGVGGGMGGYGGGYGGQGNYWAASQQSSSYDQMLQAQGVSYQMGMGSGQYGGGMGGFGGGYNAGYSPLNAGLTFGAQFGGGMGGGWYP